MARTREGALLTERHRLLQLGLSAAVLRDLLTLWRTVDPRNLADTLDPFVRAGIVIVRAGRRASGAAASRYYVEFRRAEGQRGQVVVTLPELPEDAVVAGALRGAALAGMTRARGRGLEPAQALQNGYVKLAGSATQLVLGGGRETLMGAIRGDHEARGWQRVTSGRPCAFCAEVASRGIIAGDEASAGFEAHSHCGCTAEPAFEGSHVRPDNERFRQDWDEATQGLSGGEASNAYRRHLGQ